MEVRNRLACLRFVRGQNVGETELFFLIFQRRRNIADLGVFLLLRFEFFLSSSLFKYTHNLCRYFMFQKECQQRKMCVLKLVELKDIDMRKHFAFHLLFTVKRKMFHLRLLTDNYELPIPDYGHPDMWGFWLDQ